MFEKLSKQSIRGSFDCNLIVFQCSPMSAIMAKVVDPIVVIGLRHLDSVEATPPQLKTSSAEEMTTTHKKFWICLHYLIRSLRIVSIIIVAIVLISNPISFLSVAIIHWKCDFRSNLPQLMIVWSFIHFVIYSKLIYLKVKNHLNAEYLLSKTQILLNFCIIVWFVVFMLLVVILSNGTPDDFNKLLISYLLFNMFISFVLFGIPCILLIAPVICDSR